MFIFKDLPKAPIQLRYKKYFGFIKKAYRLSCRLFSYYWIFIQTLNSIILFIKFLIHFRKISSS
ncbi:MAG: hypothetical protein D6785_03795 [Planctomycetota bacterium]|nr:MAG: hypothetical protein D6785_03795 [Planctomycetota bacterium]